jgi:hypothetical protein
VCQGPVYINGPSVARMSEARATQAGVPGGELQNQVALADTASGVGTPDGAIL